MCPKESESRVDRKSTPRSSSLMPGLDIAEATIARFLEESESKQEGFVTWQDMVRLAQGNGVVRVSKRPLNVAGLSMPMGTERVIIIKQEDGPARQRFTLAHEIAHLFLDEDAKQEVWRRTPTGAGQAANDKFESYCDRLAARILMPRAWLVRDLKDKSPMPSLLLQLAEKYRVSRQPLCIRAVELLDGAYHVAEWRRETDQKGIPCLRRKWQAAARGLSRIMPETTTTHSPIGELLGTCLASDMAIYSGDLVRESKREPVEMRACLIQKSPSPSMLVVTRRAKPRRETLL